MALPGISVPRTRLAVITVVRDRRFLVYTAALACLPLALAVYWPYVGAFFVWDDFFFLRAVRNHSFPVIMARAFTFPEGKLFDEVSLFWRPLIDLYFYSAKPWGIHAQPFHLVNIGLHGIVGALAVVFIWRLSRSSLAAAASGLLFTAAPTYDFAVTWIAEVSELLGAALVLAALITFHAYVTSRRHGGLLRVGLITFVVLAFLTKESSAIVVVLLPLVALSLPPEQRHRNAREIALALALVIVLGVAFVLAMGIHEYSRPDHLQSIGLHMARNLWRYLKWMVLPYRYDWAPHLREALAAAFLASGVVALVLRQRHLALLFGWTLLALVPFIGFKEWIELRYTYLAALPFTAFMVCGVVKLVDSFPRRLARPAIALVVLAVAVALIITPFRTRDEQAAFAQQSADYEQMVNGVRDLCGPMPPGSFVYVVRPPYLDLWGIHTPAAVNLYYYHVNAVAVHEVPPLAAFINSKCVIQYDDLAGRYFRVE